MAPLLDDSGALVFCSGSRKLEMIFTLLDEGAVNYIQIFFRSASLKIKTFITIIVAALGAIKTAHSIYLQNFV
jgi:hypothetical protein